ARQSTPPTASSQKWLAVATMTTRVSAGYSSPRTRTHGTDARAKTVRPHHTDQPMCIDGMAAYWLDMFFRFPEAIEPQVWCTITVSMKLPPFIRRGGASGNR